jgi:hypothetical protein
MVKRLAFIVAMLFIPALARADSVWTYQGNVLSAGGFLNGDGGVLTGTVLLNSNNQVEAWTFIATGGPLPIFTNANSSDVSFNLFNCTLCAGTPFKGWSISMFVANPFFGGTELSSSYNPDTGAAFDYVNNHDGSLGQVWVLNNPGVWTEVVSTPEPSSFVSLLGGLAALGLIIFAWKTYRGNPPRIETVSEYQTS